MAILLSVPHNVVRTCLKSTHETTSTSKYSSLLRLNTCDRVFFALAEVLLMIGVGVESGHLSHWTSPRTNCHAIRPGVFAVAGVFGLATVFLGVGLYLTALRMQRLHLEEEMARRGRVPNGPSPYPNIPPAAPGIPNATMGAHQSQQQSPQQLDKTSTSA